MYKTPATSSFHSRRKYDNPLVTHCYGFDGLSKMQNSHKPTHRHNIYTECTKNCAFSQISFNTLNRMKFKYITIYIKLKNRFIYVHTFLKFNS